MAYDPRRVKPEEDSNNINPWQVNLTYIFISLTRWMQLQEELNFNEQNILE